MKDFFQTLQDAFPVLKTHPVLMARLLLAAIIIGAIWAVKGWRRKIFGPLCSNMYRKIGLTNRWVFVYQNGNIINGWKYYTSEVTGKGDTGDDMIWTLVRWPSLKPIDSFRMAGAVGMENALHESTLKLEARWKIIHNPDTSIGPVPARGLLSKGRRVSSLIGMCFARRIVLAVLTVALAAYGLDCSASTTPEQAMQCCKSMRCSTHHHHGQDCCKTMPAMKAALGQPSSVQGISFTPVALGVIAAFNESHGMESSARMIAEHSHAPPILSPPAVLSLRI